MKTDSIKEKTGSFSGVKTAILLLSIIGIGVAAYLTYIHYRDINSICLFNAKCDTVLTSQYAQIWGVPLALFGLVVYVALAILGVLNLAIRIPRQDIIGSGIYGLALSGTLFSLYLYYLEIFEIHAFCSWCIISSIVMFSLFVLSIINLRNSGFRSREFRRWISRYVQW